MSQLEIICIVVVFAVLALSSLPYRWVRNRLKEKHPKKFAEMGSPSLVLTNSPATTWRFLKYLYRAEWRSLDDPRLARVSAILLVFYVVYVIVLFGLFCAT